MFAFTLFLAITSLFGPVSALLYDYYQQDGVTRLIGSSFGVLGVNQTYDYVVCGILSSESQLWSIPLQKCRCALNCNFQIKQTRLIML